MVAQESFCGKIDYIAIYWIIAVATIYVNRAYNRKKNHHVSIVEWKIVGMQTSFWRYVAYHAFTVLLEPLLLPFGIPAFLFHRAKEKKENKKLQEFVIRVEPNLTKDLYYKASDALVNALAYGKFRELERLLANEVQVIQEGHKAIKEKSTALKYWRDWKAQHLDTIDLDAFDRIFCDADFEVVQSKDESHASVKLMMTQEIVSFEINEKRVVKMTVDPLVD